MTRTNLFLELFSQAVTCDRFRASNCLPLTKKGNSVSASFLSSRPVRTAVLFLIAAVFVIGSGTTSSAGSFSTELSQLAWFWKPPSDGNLDTLAKNYDNYMLSHGDEKVRDALKGKGVTEPFLMYMRFEAIAPKGCSERPNRNQAAYQIGDYCNITKYHSDWFLRDKYGNKIKVDGYEMMDPGNSGWRSFWLSRTKAAMSNYGWDGVMMDNVDASFGRFKQMGKYPTRYSSESAYVSAVKGMLSYIYSNLGRTLMGNVTFVKSETWFSYLQYLHGAMDEGMIVDWHSGYRSSTNWDEDVRRIEKTQSMGRRMVAVAQGDKSNTFRQTFAYASYLLAANGKAVFRYGKAEYYKYAWLYSNYNIDLGSPLGPRYYSDGWWKRDFTRGKVSVNPSSHEARISGSSTSTSDPPTDDDGDSDSGSRILVQKEAEAGTLSSPMRKQSGTYASGGYYILVPNGSGDNRGKATYSISVGRSGTYYLWGLVSGPSSSSNSFGVQWDGSSTIHTWSVPITNNWVWHKISSSFSLSTGTHTLTIRGKEDGTKLDHILVVNDSNYHP